MKTDAEYRLDIENALLENRIRNLKIDMALLVLLLFCLACVSFHLITVLI